MQQLLQQQQHQQLLQPQEMQFAFPPGGPIWTLHKPLAGASICKPLGPPPAPQHQYQGTAAPPRLLLFASYRRHHATLCSMSSDTSNHVTMPAHLPQHPDYCSCPTHVSSPLSLLPLLATVAGVL